MKIFGTNKNTYRVETQKYKNMVVIDSISMDKTIVFITIYTDKFWGIITGILVVIGEFWKRYSLRKLHIEVNYE